MLHASPPQWPVNPEGVASGEWHRVTVKTANRSVANRRKRSAGRSKMCKTKPIWNQRKAHCRLRLNRPFQSLGVENEAKARRQWLENSGQWPAVSECEAGGPR